MVCEEAYPFDLFRSASHEYLSHSMTAQCLYLFLAYLQALQFLLFKRIVRFIQKEKEMRTSKVYFQVLDIFVKFSLLIGRDKFCQVFNLYLSKSTNKVSNLKGRSQEIVLFRLGIYSKLQLTFKGNVLLFSFVRCDYEQLI